MKIGYARISTGDQSLDLQRDAIKTEGCSEIFEDVASGSRQDREGLIRALQYLREGDVLIVWKLDRLGRSLKHLIELGLDLQSKGIHLKSLRENIDTETPIGKLFFHLIAALAEFERDIIRDRTRAGLEAARSRGKFGGRKPLLDTKQIEMAHSLMNSGVSTMEEISKMLGVSRTTLYRHTKKICQTAPDSNNSVSCLTVTT